MYVIYREREREECVRVQRVAQLSILLLIREIYMGCRFELIPLEAKSALLWQLPPRLARTNQ